MMKRFDTICRIYALAVLLGVGIVSPFPNSLVAAGMASVLLFSVARPLPTRVDMTVSTSALFLTAVLAQPVFSYAELAPLLPPVLATLLALPTLCLLDTGLRRNARSLVDTVSAKQEGKHLTAAVKTLFLTSAVMLAVAIVLGNLALLFTDVLLAAYLATILAIAFFAIPKDFVAVSPVWRRIIAGTSVTIPLAINSRAAVRSYCLVTPEDSWVKATPPKFSLDRSVSLDLQITPPLAGPARPRLYLAAIDSWGFSLTDQSLEPVELHVIPRARFAEWLARQYLEQAGTWTSVPVSLPEVRLLKRGIEYYDSRHYQPGDMLKDIDWKHTLKLSRLVIKEYIEANERVAIIAANLAVSDSGEADKLAYNLISAALTLAQEHIPTALAAYNHERVIVATPILSPREVVQKSLALVKEIAIVDFAPRVLQPPDLSRLRRDISQLAQAASEPARRLRNMLDFEYEAVKDAARTHPATIALNSVAQHIPASAAIVLISELNHDAEALMLTLDRLKRQDFTIITAVKRQLTRQ